MKHINFLKTLLIFLKLCILGLLIGALCGLISTVFSHLLTFLTGLRETVPWLILFLPIGGIGIVMLYRALKVEENYGTNTTIMNLKNRKEIKPAVAPLIFISTAITHFLGGSAGKEGAAIQIGGSAASAISKFLRLKNEEQTVFVMCGMGAMFAGMFGTPLAAAFFVLEFKSNRKTVSLATLPCIISAIVAKDLSSVMGVTEEKLTLTDITPFSFGLMGKVFVLAIGLYLLGMIMCYVFSEIKNGTKKLIPNSFLRIILGSIVIIVLTACVGDMRYNGSGMNMAIFAIEGHCKWFDFILKIIFTAVTLSVGFRGGEIVPTFCIGATFGCLLGSIIGIDVTLSAALGLVGLFCCATNSLFSSVFLGVELFGFAVLPYLAIVLIMLWLLPTKNCLFENRFFKSPFVLIVKNKKQKVR